MTRQSGRGMITAVDASVLLDVFGADPTFGPRSRKSVRSCLTEGRLIACEVVWVEVASFFPSPAAAQDAMDRLGVAYSPIELKTALAASRAWKVYRKRIADLLTPRPDGSLLLPYPCMLLGEIAIPLLVLSGFP